MKTYKFKLQTLLDHRKNLEHSAEEEFLIARARRIECEHDIDGCAKMKDIALGGKPRNLDGLRELDRYLERLNDEARALLSTLSVLLDEEESARQAWLSARTEAEVVMKLREKDYQEWRTAMDRQEQKDLDEWAVIRRAA